MHADKVCRFDVRVPLFLAVLVLITSGESQAQQTADWVGGSARWSASEDNWRCGGSIGDLDGDCIPNGNTIDVTISSFVSGATVTLDTNVTTHTLTVDGGNGLIVSSGVSITNALEDLIGANSSGTLTINAGGVVNDPFAASVGLGPGSSGTVNVSGAGSRWNANLVTIGGAGQGTVNVTNGGFVSATGGLADLAGSSGTVTISGAGSRWNSTFLNIGVAGQANFNVQNGGVVNLSGTGTAIGSNPGANGTLDVTGTGSQFNSSTAPVYIAGGGLGTMVVDLGATGSSSRMALGVEATSAGSFLVGDPGSQWSNGTGEIDVGYAGTGAMIVQNGATFADAGSLFDVGVLSGSSGSVQVDRHSQFSAINTTLHIGDAGTGRLKVQNGATMTVSGLVIGVQAGSYGSVDLEWIGQLTNAYQSGNDQIIVGQAGFGSLSLGNGATVSDNVGLLVGNGPGTGRVTIERNGQYNTVSASIGVVGTGTVLITGQNSSLNAVDGTISVGPSTSGANGSGVLMIADGGTVTDTTGIVAGAGGTGTVTVSGVGSTWTNEGNLYVGIGGPGTLNINNGGLVSAGTLIHPGTVTIGSMGVVHTNNGVGTLEGNIHIDLGGIYDPVGISNVIGSFTLDPGAILQVEADGTGNGHVGVLDVSGTGVFDGTLVIDFINGFVPHQGDTFTFIQDSGGASGNFQNIEILGLSQGFQYTDAWVNGDFTLTAENSGTVPEPAELPLLATGLTLIGLFRFHAVKR